MSTIANDEIDDSIKRLGIRHDVSLKKLNTFGFDARAEYFATAQNDQHLVELLEYSRAKEWPVFVLGGGSNLVLTRDISGLVLCLGSQEINYARQPDGSIHVTAGAGVNWHALVMDTLDRGHTGLENLSLIPGTVGAAPVQNIGAYGVELVDRIVSLRAWHQPTRQFRTLNRVDCKFAYRDSLFKRERGDWIVVSVKFTIGGATTLVTTYASLAERLLHQNVSEVPTSRAVSQAVIAIRQERLPNPETLGNAGSFFHNPIVTSAQFSRLVKANDGLVGNTMRDGRVKIAAGWLIDRLGYRGYRRGDVGVHEQQALVLVNHGKGTSEQLLTLVAEIQGAVREAYAIKLTVEPLVV
jgi:UDP-N-acetylmuramate dehydrogenase